MGATPWRFKSSRPHTRNTKGFDALGIFLFLFHLFFTPHLLQLLKVSHLNGQQSLFVCWGKGVRNFTIPNVYLLHTKLFESGLITDITPSDLETRIVILRKEDKATVIQEHL